jgi:hypothetical protein
MQTTYINASNTGTNGTALSAGVDDDVRLFKLIVGAPVSAGNIWVYKITNPLNASTANIAVKITLPTFSTTNINPGVYVFDFGPQGLALPQGGNIIIDQTMQVTAMWELADNSQA